MIFPSGLGGTELAYGEGLSCLPRKSNHGPQGTYSVEPRATRRETLLGHSTDEATNLGVFFLLIFVQDTSVGLPT